MMSQTLKFHSKLFEAEEARTTQLLWLTRGAPSTIRLDIYIFKNAIFLSSPKLCFKRSGRTFRFFPCFVIMYLLIISPRSMMANLIDTECPN
ncbi:hypothetical protein GDO81_005325 [Engystomops pustulosus]|uniref:Uncharacterized protein n=1 Tax=Engystomops pustulosus TaxID=76066 RepID=A0AAV7CMH1_ENGPU|nr:hypothetical protein GDO81_005325 [Engystomops pustulosus]